MSDELTDFLKPLDNWIAARSWAKLLPPKMAALAFKEFNEFSTERDIAHQAAAAQVQLLSQEIARLTERCDAYKEALAEIADTPIRVCNGYLRCTDRFVSAHVTEIACAALATHQAKTP